MAVTDMQDTLLNALARIDVDHVLVEHQPRLHSDNDSCYVSKELQFFLKHKHIEHTRSTPHNPMILGKIEHYHRSMKNIVTLQTIFFLGILNLRSVDSWTMTITSAITSRWTISPRLMFILVKRRRCYPRETRSKSGR